MAKVSLQEFFDTHLSLTNALQVSNSLISNMEVVGYINSCSDEKMLNALFNSTSLNGIANHDSRQQIVCANHLYQVLPYSNGSQLQMKGVLFPIYTSLTVADEDMKVNIVQLEIPSLHTNYFYKKIKARISEGFIVDENMLKKAKFPDTIVVEDGEAIMLVRKGATLCMNKDRQIKGIGEAILALCRYVHPATGIVNYGQFELTDLYIDDNENTL